MSTPLSAAEQIAAFAAAIYQPADLVEVRMIRRGMDEVSSRWYNAGELPDHVTELEKLNAGGMDIYIGVNPRKASNQRGDSNVKLARTVFADFDQCPIEESLLRIQSCGLPRPTVINASGHGTHSYWLLAEPIEDMDAWRELQKDLAALVGGDPVVFNPERIMRLVGMKNYKPPIADAELIECYPSRIFSDEFLALIPKRKTESALPAMTRIEGRDDDAGRHWLGKALAKASIGKRNDTGVWLACQLRDARLTESEAATIMREYAERVPQGDDRYTEAAALASNRSAYSKPAREVAKSSGVYAGEKQPRQIAERQPATRKIENTTPMAPAFVSCRQLCQNHPQLRPPIIHGFLREGETANIVGATKTMKSWLVKQAAISVATGRTFLNKFQVERGDVLILDNELHQETLAYRIPRLCGAMGVMMDEVDDHLFVESLRGRLRDIHGLADYFLSIERGRFKLIILDALYRLLPVGTDENSNADMANVFNAIDRYADHIGCAFIAVHHSSKGMQAGKAVTDVGAGAGAQSRAADAHIVLRPHEEEDAVVCEAAIRSWAPVAPFCLRWDYPMWKSADDLDPTLLRKNKKAKADTPVASKPEPWTLQRFIETFLSNEPQTESRIAVAAEGILSARKVKAFITAGVEANHVYRWTYGNQKISHRFARIEQPITAIASQK